MLMPVDEYGQPDVFSGHVSCGTTIMAVEYDGGVVLGADTRTTSGAYIVNRVADKLTSITDHIYCCRSGSAADTQAISDVVRFRANLLSLTLGEDDVTVALVAHNFREICYKYRDNTQAGIIVAGWDHKKGGQVYTIPLGGMCIRERCALGGSGSSYIYGFVDAARQTKPNMTQPEAEELVLKSITLAIKRDGSSGGCVRTCTINKDGSTKKLYMGNELPVFDSL